MKKIITIFILTVTLMLGTGLYLFKVSASIKPFVAYEIYIDGRSIGFIKNKVKLENYIDEEQKAIKEKYKVSRVYMPVGVKIQKRTTYFNNFRSEKEIYSMIKKAKLFAIDGYQITIHGKKPIIISSLQRGIFVEALNKTIRNFVNPELYQAYIDDKEIVIETTGSRIENAKLSEKITIRKTLISTGDTIFTNAADINKYLLFGTLKEQKKYTVGVNENLEDIAFKNNLSIEEIMVANSEFKTANTLLYPGQVISVGLISPLVHIEVDEHVVSDKTLKYDTETKYDPKMLAGYSKVESEGENGSVRVTEKIKYINGEMIPPVITVSKTVLKPAVNKVVVVGGRMIASIGGGSWRWPTIAPYVITSRFGYRWGRMHTGIDISGCGHGSPIFASNNGVVSFAGYWDAYGNAVVINHNNGYYTVYAHMSKIFTKTGQIVKRGQVVGAMGNTGRSFGTHLHFEIRNGDPKKGAAALNPLNYL